MEFEIEVEAGIDEIDQCHSCMGDHDENVHAATLRVRNWLRSEVNRKLGPAAAKLSLE
ncbi:MAG: hypothetical protein ACR2I2_03840 [Bryobacteraceae bacterium]